MLVFVWLGVGESESKIVKMVEGGGVVGSSIRIGVGLEANIRVSFYPSMQEVADVCINTYCILFVFHNVFIFDGN